MVTKIFRPFVILFFQGMSLIHVLRELDRSRAYWSKLCKSPTISDAEYRTLQLLHYLAPPQNGSELPPIDLKTVAELRHLTTRTIQSHLSHLKKQDLIQSHPLPDQKRQISLTGPKPFNPPLPEHSAAYQTDYKLAGQQYSAAEEEQQYNSLEIEELQQAIAEIFIQGGHTRSKALGLALTLITTYGPQICATQLAHLDRRCEIFQNSPRGLKSRPGVLTASIKENWPPPPKPQEKTWYSEEEFDQLIEH